MLQLPPRLLLGVAMLFWGAMGDYPFIGLLSAIALEARHWIRLHWRFGEKGFARAWQLCVVILVIVTVSFLTSDEELVSSASLELLSWLPIIFLPLALAQQYASDRGVPLVCFSFIAYRKIQIDRRAGREVKLKPCYIGFPYLGMILVSAGLGVDLEFVSNYGICVAVLFGIGLYFMRGERARPFAWVTAYLLAAAIGLGLSWSVFYLFAKFKERGSPLTEVLESAREVRTRLGQIKKLQLSEDIDWRYYQNEGKAPERLRLAVYNRYTLNAWQTVQRSPKIAEKIDPDRSTGGDFESIFTSDENFFYEEKHRATELPNLSRVVGLVTDESLVPLPLNPRRFEKTSVNGLDVNGMGSTRLDDPEDSALEIKISSSEQRRMDSVDLDPTISDLVIPIRELPGLVKYWESLGVDELPRWEFELGRRSRMMPIWNAHETDREEQEALLTYLKATFRREFSYSLNREETRKDYAVTDFLNVEDKEKQKKGHCEYFATSSALLLRRAGIPTRYVVGYALAEKGSKSGEWLLRGAHAHAWAQAYVGGTWVNEAAPVDEEPVWRCRGGKWVEIDNTPESWLDSSQPKRDWKRRLADWWQKARPDLIIWFNGPIVSVIVGFLLYGGVIGLVGYIIYRLWTTRSGRNGNLAESWERRALSQNPLADFERWLAKKVGPRPAGTPLGEWLESEAPELVPLYQKVRFDPGSGSPDDLDQVAQESRDRLKK
ncbi:transglutaminase-like domain-containing protein [Akkermansiaceae bacterium]|nr:transglutaminase-like domain-containing protein [Akkermansiaceae bacterium]